MEALMQKCELTLTIKIIIQGFLISMMKTQTSVILKHVKTMSSDTLPPLTKHILEDVSVSQKVCKAK